MHSLFNSNILTKLSSHTFPVLHGQAMKYSLIIFLFTFGTLKAQPMIVSTAVKDSLENLILSQPGDTNKVNTLIALSNIYTILNPDLAKKHAQEGLDLALQLNYLKGQILGHSSLSFLYSITGEWAKGIDAGFKGLQIAQGNEIGLKLYAINNLATGFQKQKDFKKSLEWSSKSIELVRQNKISPEIAQWASYFLHGINCAELGVLDSALMYSKYSYEIAQRGEGHMVSGYSIDLIGTTYSKLKMYDSAITYLKSARDIMIQLNNKFALQEVNRDLAQTFFKMELPDSAEQYAKLAYTNALQMNNPIVVQDASWILSRLYEKSDVPNAYAYLKIHNRIKDSLSTIDKAQQVQQAEMNEQKKQADLQVAEIKASNQIKQNALLGSLTTLLLVALILWYNNRRTQKTNELLKKQKREIEEQRDQLKATQDQLVQSEKMASLGELTAGIAHEIQNPLNFVNNFSEVNSELLTELEEELKTNSSSPEIQNYILLLRDIKDNELKINYHGRRADSIVKGMLQHSRKGSGIKELTDLNALCDEYLRLAYHGYKAKDKTFNADFETHFDPALPKVNVVTQDFGRVILNIINNAFYALTDQDPGLTSNKPKVTVSTKYYGNSGSRAHTKLKGPYAQITISDNGPGIPHELKDKIFQPFFTTKPTGSGTGLGLSLAYEIVTNVHGGELILDSEEGKGSAFIIRIPVENL